MSITLPPPPGDWECGRFFDPEELRARDIEVAKVVLEGAARIAEKHFHTTTAKEIRALEIKHD